MLLKLKWVRFLIFSILRILPLRFRTAENTSNFRRNTDKYGRLATLIRTHAELAKMSSVLRTAQIRHTLLAGRKNLEASQQCFGASPA